MNLTPGEKLIIHMLVDINRHLKVQGEIDAEFIGKAVAYDYPWAIQWEYGGLIGAQEKSPANVSETVDYLDMWTMIELGYEKLTSDQKKELAVAAPHWGAQGRFPGFDGNAEGGHFHIATFLVDDMGRWERFKGRDLNSHFEVIPEYRSMYAVFEPIRPKVTGRTMTLDELTAVLSAA